MSEACNKLPPKPVPPEPDECCGAGCMPCVYDLYEQQLERWEARVRALQARQSGLDPEGRQP